MGSSQAASSASAGASGSSATRGALRGAAYYAGSEGHVLLPYQAQSSASQSSTSSRGDPVDEDANAELPSFQRSSTDVHMASPRHDGSAGAGECASPAPRGAAARNIAFQTPLDLYST